MLHQWSILFHGQRGGRLSVVRRRDIDQVAAGGGSDAPTDAPVDSPGDATPTDGLDAPLDDAPIAPNLEELFADPKVDDPALVDPNAPPITVPPVFQQAMGISEFVKDPSQLAGAVTLADQVLKVQNGNAPISGLMENFRAQNELAFVKAVNENLIPYIEQITGMKLMDPAKAGTPTEKTPEQQRIDAIEARFTEQQNLQQQAQQNAAVNRAGAVLLAKTDEALKGTFLEGKGRELVAQLAPHMGMSEAQAVQALNSGNTTMVDKAVKALMVQKEAEGRAYAKWKIAESKTLKAGLPAGKGNPRMAAPGELAEGATMADKIAYLNAAS